MPGPWADGVGVTVWISPLGPFFLWTFDSWLLTSLGITALVLVTVTVLMPMPLTLEDLAPRAVRVDASARAALAFLLDIAAALDAEDKAWTAVLAANWV